MMTHCKALKLPGSLLVTLAVIVVGFSLAEAGTVAYWRFEPGPAGTLVPHAGADGVFDGTTADDSGNGNHLSAWSPGGWAGFAYRTDVAFAAIPQHGTTNKFSVKNTGAYPAMFTSPTGGLPSGLNALTITPAQFTVEVFYKPEASGGYRTVVGRDARNVATSNGELAAFYLQVRPDDSVGVAFTDVSGYVHAAFSPPGWIYGFNFGSNPEGTGAPWYQLAVVSDGSTLKMYVNNALVASTDMTASGSPNRALARGSASGSDWTTGAWSVGRGLYAGGHTDRAYGFIDEVRISNSALAPREFLSAPRPQIAKVTGLGGVMTLNVTSGQPYFYSLRAPISPPPAGALTYGLAGGSENWPADIRAQIVYAMDGAVAEYNRYGTFRKHVTANYNPGVPTAQANYDGWIDFGGQIGYRTALHEISHTLGVGTFWNWSTFLQGGVWTGANGMQQVRAFDGPTATISSDGTHFWPYGLNYENEGGTENSRRHVLMVAGFHKDMGIQ